MHITFLADCLDNQRAGVHVYSRELIKAITKLAPENRYSFVHKVDNDFFLEREHYQIPRKKIPGYDSFRKFILIPRLLKKLKPDIVVEMAHIGPFRTPQGSQRVTVIHDLTPVLFPQFHIPRSVLIHRLFLKSVIKKADLIITPSRHTKQNIEEKYSRKKNFAIIPPGLPPKITINEKTLVDTPYLLYLGTLEPRKNLPLLIDSFLELKAEKKLPHKLVLAGEAGWKIKQLLPQTKHPEILTPGFVSEKKKANLLQNAALFIYPSFYEGFGIPPLEAMQYGTPVICSNGGSLREIYQNHAIIFDPHEKKMLKMAIEQVIDNPELKTNLQEKGKIFAQNYDWEKSAEKALQAFKKLSKNGIITR